MSIRKKIEKENHLSIESMRDEIISRAGHVISDIEKKNEKKEWMNFCLRIKVEMLEKIDESLNETVGISKTGWILQAIHEKLIRIKF